jgi:signal transduction histidine kinase
LQQIAKQGQKIVFTPSGSGELNVDVNLMKNIISNLVSNAIKFSAENSNIEVILDAGESDLLLSVKDSGIGISEEDQQHLFERFFRARNALNIQGTGLGLHIVSKYVELMKGHIDMHSELDKGTTFYIHIPQ